MTKAKQILAQATKKAPRSGANTRTRLDLERMPGGRASRGRGRDVAPELIDALAEKMIAAGAEPGEASKAASFLALKVGVYLRNSETWRQEPDREARVAVDAAGDLARALEAQLGALGPRAKRFIHESMREDDFHADIGGMRKQTMAFLAGLQSAAAKLRRVSRRPINAPAQELLREAARAWRAVVGALPKRSSDRITEERTSALFVTLRRMVDDAAAELPDRAALVNAISDSAFRGALSVVAKEFE